MPTIAELLTAYRDRTGASYEDMARKVDDEINRSRMHQLATAPPKEFPKRARTVELLAQLLEVPVTTIVLAFAKGLGIPVQSSNTLLADTLPPGTDLLTAEDREVVRVVARALVDARHALMSGRDTESFVGPFYERPPITSPEPATVEDYGLAARRGPSEGQRLRHEQDLDAES